MFSPSRLCGLSCSTLFPYTTLFRSVAAARDSFLATGCTGGSFGAGDARTAKILEKRDRKSTRLNSSHVKISYAVFCLKKKKAEYQRRGGTRLNKKHNVLFYTTSRFY